MSTDLNIPTSPGFVAPPGPPAESPLARAARILSGNIRPDDYLPVSEEDVAFVDGSEARTGIKLLPEYRRKMISCLALQEHHGGNEVLTFHTLDGVIVLAAGGDEVDWIAKSLPREQQSRTVIEYPPGLFDERPPPLE